MTTAGAQQALCDAGDLLMKYAITGASAKVQNSLTAHDAARLTLNRPHNTPELTKQLCEEQRGWPRAISRYSSIAAEPASLIQKGCMHTISSHIHAGFGHRIRSVWSRDTIQETAE